MTKKSGLIVAIATLITIISWVVFDVIHARTQTQIPSDVQQLTQPLNKDFDLGGLK